ECALATAAGVGGQCGVGDAVGRHHGAQGKHIEDAGELSGRGGQAQVPARTCGLAHGTDECVDPGGVDEGHFSEVDDHTTVGDLLDQARVHSTRGGDVDLAFELHDGDAVAGELLMFRVQHG